MVHFVVTLLHQPQAESTKLSNHLRTKVETYTAKTQGTLTCHFVLKTTAPLAGEKALVSSAGTVAREKSPWKTQETVSNLTHKITTLSLRGKKIFVIFNFSMTPDGKHFIYLFVCLFAFGKHFKT